LLQFRPFLQHCLTALFPAVLFASLTTSTLAESYDQTTLQGKTLYTVHLIEDSRYGEAADSAQKIIDSHPDLPFGYELRGVLGLYYGNIRRARGDFHAALGVDPGNPNCEYGMGLCDLFDRDYANAGKELKQAGLAAPLTAQQAEGINSALAYLALLQSNTNSAADYLGTAEADTNPTRLEILAFLKNKQSPGSADDILKSIVIQPNGVPHVVEPEGVRPNFLSSNLVLEPAISDPTTRSMYNARLEQNVRQSQHAVGKLLPASGVLTLNPPISHPYRIPSLVSYYVDDHCDLIVNAAPFQYRWDTNNVSNGRHRIRIDLTDTGGQVFASRQLEFDVYNQINGVVGQAESTIPESDIEQINQRIWQLISLKPCYKVANYLLSVNESRAGNVDLANLYRATAAAIDPTYKDGRSFMRGLLKEDVGASNPVAVWQGSIQGNRVALTFDDGPNNPKSSALLDALDKCGVPATFFVVGSRAAIVPDVVRRMRARGDEIENHSYTHPNMAQSAPLDAEEEILRNEVMVRSLSGRYPRFFRPPGGDANGTVSRLTRSYGLTLAFWTVDALQFEDAASPKAIVAYIMKRLHPGDIILMHNGSDATTKALPLLVAALKGRGYKCVTVAQIGNSPKSHKPVAEQMAAVP